MHRINYFDVKIFLERVFWVKGAGMDLA